MVFHAGTAWTDGALIATGGRVLGVTARADSLRTARDEAVAVLKGVPIAVDVVAIDRAGMPGLRVTRIRQYRDLYERQQRF